MKVTTLFKHFWDAEPERNIKAITLPKGAIGLVVAAQGDFVDVLFPDDITLVGGKLGHNVEVITDADIPTPTG